MVLLSYITAESGGLSPIPESGGPLSSPAPTPMPALTVALYKRKSQGQIQCNAFSISKTKIYIYYGMRLKHAIATKNLQQGGERVPHIYNSLSAKKMQIPFHRIHFSLFVCSFVRRITQKLNRFSQNSVEGGARATEEPIRFW